MTATIMAQPTGSRTRRRRPNRPWLELAGGAKQREGNRKALVQALHHFEAAKIAEARRVAAIARAVESVDTETLNRNGRETGKAFCDLYDLLGDYDAGDTGAAELHERIHALFGTENDYHIGEHVAGHSVRPT